MEVILKMMIPRRPSAKAEARSEHIGVGGKESHVHPHSTDLMGCNI